MAILDMPKNSEIEEKVTTVNITDDAVGVPNSEADTTQSPLFWFIGITKTNAEKRLCNILAKHNYTTYLPTQTEEHQWSQGRRRKIARRILPGYIFVHCTESRRKAVFSDLEISPTVKPYLSRWMMDKATATKDGKHQFATVPDREMQQFMLMVEKANNPVTIEPSRLRKGDHIRVTRGDLMGCTGELEQLPDNTAKLVIRIPNLGAAKVSIDLADIEIIP